ILDTGNVGIGTTSPSTDLDIGGRSGNSPGHELGGFGIGNQELYQTQYPLLSISSDITATNAPSQTGISLYNKHGTGDTLPNTYSPYIAFSSKEDTELYNSQYAVIAGQHRGEAVNSNWQGGDLTFWTRRVNGGQDYDLHERMRIDYSGNVGIGTTQFTGITAPGLVLPNNRALYGVNAAGNNTVPMVSIDSGNNVVLGPSSTLSSIYKETTGVSTSATTIFKNLNYGGAFVMVVGVLSGSGAEFSDIILYHGVRFVAPVVIASTDRNAAARTYTLDPNIDNELKLTMASGIYNVRAYGFNLGPPGG
ncbi:MAG: hypothetical protein HY456_00360, partial [Parcubacteria group bacterium]|nr:hypothetical protein [Parcubacteria group bacterium]